MLFPDGLIGAGGRGCCIAGPGGGPPPPGPSNRGLFAGGKEEGGGVPKGGRGPEGIRLFPGWYGRLGPIVGPGLGEGRTGE